MERHSGGLLGASRDHGDLADRQADNESIPEHLSLLGGELGQRRVNALITTEECFETILGDPLDVLSEFDLGSTTPAAMIVDDPGMGDGEDP